MIIILLFYKGSPDIQYLDDLTQRNLVENQETWYLLLIKKQNGCSREVIQTVTLCLFLNWNSD